VEWDGPHRTVNPDSWSAAGSIPAVPTAGHERSGRPARRPKQRREVAQLEARRHRKPEVAGSIPAFPTQGWVAQWGRASVLYSEGRGFDSRPNLLRAISSAEERPPNTREVGGSIPPLPTRGSVAQADQSGRLLTGRLEVRFLPDPLRLVVCYSWKDTRGWRVGWSRKPSPGRPGLGFDPLPLPWGIQSMGHWSRGQGRPVLSREVEGSSPSCPTFRRRSQDGRALAW
jgi:hypothetical protein